MAIVTHRKVSSGTVNGSVEVDLYDWNDTHVGLENVDNTADVDKPVPSAVATTLEQHDGGTVVVDNSAALNAAIASAAGGIHVLLGKGTYNFTTTPSSIAKSNVIIEGAGDGVTVLEWVSGTLLTVDSGYTEGSGFQLRNLTLYSALKLVDQSRATLENVTISGAGTNSILTGGGNSTGVYSQGREFLRTKNVSCYANIPVRLGKNPNSYLSTDHYDLTGLYLIGDTANPLIQVDPGVVVSNMTIGAAFVLGTHGFYWADTGAVNHVSVINAGGSGYVAGEALTMAGGTFSTACTVRVITVSSGAVTSAAIVNPGVYTVLPSYPASQASTTGSGTGATFTFTTQNSNGLHIADSRFEQGASAASTCVYVSPSPFCFIDNVTVSDVQFDGARKGFYGRRARHIRLTNTYYNPVGATLAVDVDATNECLEFQNCKWLTGCTDSIGLTRVYQSGSPTGEASGTSLAPFAVWGGTFSGMTFSDIQPTGVYYTGSSSGATLVQSAAVASGTLTLPSATDTLVGKATTDELTNKTLTSSVGKGTWTASGTWTLPAHTLGGTISGGGNQINNVIIGTSTPLAGSFTTLASSGGITPTVAPSTAWSFDSSGMAAISIVASGSSADFATGSGIVIVSENTSYGDTAMFICGGGAATLVAQAGTHWSATTTPAGANLGFAYSGSGYRIYNGTGATRNFSALTLKSRASN